MIHTYTVLGVAILLNFTHSDMLIESLTVVYREHSSGDLRSSQSKKWIFWFLHLALMNLVNVNHGP